MARTLAAAALLALCSAAHAANVDNVDMVLQCNRQMYADGFIYRNSSGNSLAGFPAKQAFPLYMASIASQGHSPLDPILPAQMTSTHVYKALDARLYVNASTGAYAPVGFVSGGNSTLGKGETTWGFYDPYGYFVFYNPLPATAQPVHLMGWKWVSVEGYSDIKQLYWNQTQYDLAAAGNTTAIDTSDTDFGACYSDSSVTVSF